MFCLVEKRLNHQTFQSTWFPTCREPVCFGGGTNLDLILHHRALGVDAGHGCIRKMRMQLILCFFFAVMSDQTLDSCCSSAIGEIFTSIRRFDRPTLARRLRSSSLGLSPAVMGDESHGSGGRQRRSSRPLILMQRGEGFPFSDGDYIISTPPLPPLPPPRIPLRRSCMCGDGGLC